MSAERPALIVAGGGTGGHVMAGIAIADAWKTTTGGPATFVGAHGGLEEKIVPREGYPLALLSVGQLKRTSLAKKLKTLVQIPLSILRSIRILHEIRPRAVIGVGGYASGPMVLAAKLVGWIWGIRTAVLEQNAIPGFTNRWLGRIADRVFLAFAVESHPFNQRRTEVTGNPVRKSLEALPSAARSPFTIFVFGGSQGAQAINSWIIEALPQLKDLPVPIRWIHQTGERDYERVADAHRAAGSDARVERFIYDMKAAYAEASLVICRAGSSTLSEIAAVGRASILIPFPYAADDHQTHNARNFARQTGATVLEQGKSSASELAKTIRELVNNPTLITELELRARAIARNDAAHKIVQTMLSQAR